MRARLLDRKGHRVQLDHKDPQERMVFFCLAQVQEIHHIGMEPNGVLNNSNIHNNGGNIGIGTVTPDNSSKLEIKSSNKGFLPPRLTTTERDSILNPADGLIIFNINSGCPNYYYNGLWYEWCGNGVNPLGTIASLSCDSSFNYGTILSGSTCIVYSMIPYINGNGGVFNSQTINSTGVTGLVATILSDTFSNGADSLRVEISGLPISSGIANFLINIGGQSCVLQRVVSLPIGSVSTLNCGTATNTGTLTVGDTAVGVSSLISYTGGNGGFYSAQSINSSGVTGLTAHLIADTFQIGSGNLLFNITGIPCSTGIASFTVTIDTTTCTFSHNVISPINIGDFYQGGYVAYIYQVGDPGYIPCEIHGFLVAQSDFTPNTPWGCRGTFFNTSPNIGDGMSNTIQIVNGCSETNIAARLCYNLVQNGYSDWCLPSRNELSKIYLNRSLLPGILNYHYWSSTDCSVDRARTLNFVNGGWFNCSNHTTPLKDAPSTGGTRGTRAIRYF